MLCRKAFSSIATKKVCFERPFFSSRRFGHVLKGQVFVETVILKVLDRVVNELLIAGTGKPPSSPAPPPPGDKTYESTSFIILLIQHCPGREAFLA